MAKISLPIVGQDVAAPKTDSANKTREQGGDIMSEIKHEVEAHKVVLYMKGSPMMPQCGFSARAVSVLESYDIQFHSVNILADPEKRQAIKDFSEWPTIPQVYVAGEFLGGSDILWEMHTNGELKTELEKAFA
jgi:monothiol glutaredoxin